MPPDEREIDEELRGHLAIAIQERIERGESPDSARRAALDELGYLPRVRESMRSVWYSVWFDAAMDLGRDLRVGFRSLVRARALSTAVILTLALGIGANAAIFSVVRGVLLRPLVNRGEDRLVYVRQSAPGIGAANMTFSVPEIDDFKSRVTTIEAFGDFSTIDFTLVGIGEPRVVRAGVVSGAFFEVMGLQPVLGRLLSAAADDGPNAAPAAVLTYRFWTSALGSDPSAVGRTIRLGSRTATIVGVLEPSIPYPVDTEVIANVVTSPHHLDALMVTGRSHRMTELFGRLAAGATVDEARAELTAVHAAAMEENPDAYPVRNDVRVTVTPFRDAVTSQARPILIVLLAATGVVFIIACANVANLILARSVRREGELAVRAALGASRGALRRTLLAESLVLCTGGAALGVVLARPLVGVVARFASRFSVRALDVRVDTSLLWVGAALAIAAAILLAYAPKLPGSTTTSAGTLTTGGLRMTPRLNRRLKAFATAQVACSFVLLAAAGTLVAALISLQEEDGTDLSRVLAIDIPLPLESFGPKAIAFNAEVMRRVAELPGVEHVAVGNVVPWRDIGTFPPTSFAAEGYTPADGEEQPYARIRMASPGFFNTLGVPLVAGRDFTDDDRLGGELVVIVSQSVAQRLFPTGDALNRQIWWTDRTFGGARRRIVGVVADVNDQQAEPGPAMAIYHPFQQIPFAGRLFVRTAADPYPFVPVITRMIREMSPDQPVERAATLSDIRAEMLSPNRVNAFIVGGFATVAMLIAAVGIAGVLAFSVSARVREFGVRLAVGSTPLRLLLGVLSEGTSIVITGILVGAAGGLALVAFADRFVDELQLPGALPITSAAAVLIGAAVAASLIPAARASRVDVQQALRTE